MKRWGRNSFAELICAQRETAARIASHGASKRATGQTPSRCLTGSGKSQKLRSLDISLNRNGLSPTNHGACQLKKPLVAPLQLFIATRQLTKEVQPRTRRVNVSAGGKIPDCPGVLAFGNTLYECQKTLREVLEGWLIVKLRHGDALPV